MGSKIALFVSAAIGFLALVIGLGALSGLILMWSINYVFAPAFIALIFGAPILSFWKALVLGVVLSYFGERSGGSKK